MTPLLYEPRGELGVRETLVAMWMTVAFGLACFAVVVGVPSRDVTIHISALVTVSVALASLLVKSIWFQTVHARRVALLYAYRTRSTLVLTTVRGRFLGRHVLLSKGGDVVVTVDRTRAADRGPRVRRLWTVSSGKRTVRFNSFFAPDSELLADLEARLRSLGVEPRIVDATEPS